MRVAIPTFRSQISPRFDCASELLVVEVQDGEIARREERSLQNVPPFARANYLRAQGVQVVLCGGLRRRDFHELAASGIEVIAGLFGEVEPILEAYLQGQLTATTPWPGGGPRAGRHGHGRHRRGGPGFGRWRRGW